MGLSGNGTIPLVSDDNHVYWYCLEWTYVGMRRSGDVNQKSVVFLGIKGGSYMLLGLFITGIASALWRLHKPNLISRMNILKVLSYDELVNYNKVQASQWSM